VALLANIGDRSHDLEVTRATPLRVTGHTDTLDRTVGQLWPMLKIKALVAARCPLACRDYFYHYSTETLTRHVNLKLLLRSCVE
jgi:hypothetical protein